MRNRVDGRVVVRLQRQMSSMSPGIQPRFIARSKSRATPRRLRRCRTTARIKGSRLGASWSVDRNTGASERLRRIPARRKIALRAELLEYWSDHHEGKRTRASELQDIFDELGKGRSFGNSTTHMGKL